MTTTSDTASPKVVPTANTQNGTLTTNCAAAATAPISAPILIVFATATNTTTPIKIFRA